MSFVEWYSQDVGAGTQGDAVGACGFAGKHRPLAMALLRLFVGDDREAKHLIPLMCQMLKTKAYRAGSILHGHEANDIAQAVLAWHRDGVCKPCGGHGYTKIEGSPGLSEHACTHCKGTRKVPFEREFKASHIELARWLVAEVEREQTIAGREAMRRLRLTITV